MNALDLKKYVGAMEQLAFVRTSVLDDGRGSGIRIADVNNGSGLRFSILLDRGMDIGDASLNGKTYAYQSPVGTVHPSHFEAGGFGWLRGFGCGLLTGCGLSNIGVPDDEHGIHGRLSNIPSENISVFKGWINGKYELSVSGTIREVSFMGENLELKRTVSTAMGDNSIRINDEITNRGVRAVPMMVLYHINAGFPLLDACTRVEGKMIKTTPRTEGAADGIHEWNCCQLPTAGYAEQCFYHDVENDADGMARVTLHNPDNGMAIEVAFRKAELPYFTQWKMMGEQEYVMGLEPSNGLLDGRSREKENRRLRILDPEETESCFVKISLSL